MHPLLAAYMVYTTKFDKVLKICALGRTYHSKSTIIAECMAQIKRR